MLVLCSTQGHSVGSDWLSDAHRAAEFLLFYMILASLDPLRKYKVYTSCSLSHDPAKAGLIISDDLVILTALTQLTLITN